MSSAPTISARVPVELVQHARNEVGRPITVGELVRLALANLANVNPDDYAILPHGGARPGAGRPRKQAEGVPA